MAAAGSRRPLLFPRRSFFVLELGQPAFELYQEQKQAAAFPPMQLDAEVDRTTFDELVSCWNRLRRGRNAKSSARTNIGQNTRTRSGSERSGDFPKPQLRRVKFSHPIIASRPSI